MSFIVSSLKGGSGATVFAAALAATHADALLVDLRGDLADVYGRRTESELGVLDWLASAAPSERLDELVVPGRPALLPAGSTRVTAAAVGSDRLRSLLRWCAVRERQRAAPVVVDAGGGRFDAGSGHAEVLVTRACYLALRRVRLDPRPPDGVVLVAEPGRSLTARDVERTIGAPVVAVVPWDPAVSRAVDAGLDGRDLPMSYRRAAGRVLRRVGAPEPTR